MFIYEQLTGKMYHRVNDKSGKPTDTMVGSGYSGAPGITKNNTQYEDIHNEGPIPRGFWAIAGPPIDTSAHGPFVLHLFPEPNTNAFGRSGFLIHGDSVRTPGTASEGCIILPLVARESIWATNDTVLRVIDQFAEPTDKGDTV